MRVAHILVGGEVSGGQVICGEIVKALRKRGDDALVISPTQGVFTNRLAEEGVPVHFIPFRKTYHIQNAFRLAALLKREKAGLVHTHGMVTANAQARLGAWMAGVPVVSHMHISNYFNRNPAIRSYQVFLDNLTSRLCEKIIAVSKATRDDLIAQGISPNQIAIVYNAIDLDIVRAGRSRESVFSEFSLPPGSFVIVTVGRLCPVKGQKELIQAMGRLICQIPGVVLLIVGKDLERNGRYETELRGLVLELGLTGKVIFTSYRADVFDLMHASDLFVLPSYVEGLPVTILEAMALGKPVIASGVGGVPELVINGETGLVVPPGDIDRLAEAIMALWKDRKKASEMTASALERITTYFSHEKMMSQIFDIYECSIDRHNRDRHCNGADRN